MLCLTAVSAQGTRCHAMQKQTSAVKLSLSWSSWGMRDQRGTCLVCSPVDTPGYMRQQGPR